MLADLDRRVCALSKTVSRNAFYYSGAKVDLYNTVGDLLCICARPHYVMCGGSLTGGRTAPAALFPPTSGKIALRSTCSSSRISSIAVCIRWLSLCGQRARP